MQPDNDEVAVDEPGEIDDVRLRWDDFPPVLRGRMVEIDGDDTPVRRVQVSQKIKDLPSIAQKSVMRIRLIQESNEWLGAIHGAIIDAIQRNCAVPDM